jgi:hypothetical protein
MNPLTFACLILSASVIGAQPALAQFPGDVFFAQPNQASLGGAPVELELSGFFGSAAFGALHLEVQFSTTDFVVESIEPSGSFDFRLHQAVVGSGRIGLAVFNDESMTEPAGTVPLLRLRVRPLVAAGQSALISVANKAGLNPGGLPYPNKNGASASIQVLPATAALSLTTLPPMEPSPQLSLPWSPAGPRPPLAPSGAVLRQLVRLPDPDQQVWSWQDLPTLDPRAASDR